MELNLLSFYIIPNELNPLKACHSFLHFIFFQVAHNVSRVGGVFSRHEEKMTAYTMLATGFQCTVFITTTFALFLDSANTHQRIHPGEILLPGVFEY